MPVSALLLQYNGTGFYGFQKQTSLISIQESLESALGIILREKVKVTGAGRTDTGVHAVGMVVSFFSSKPIPNYHKMISSVNALSAEGIYVIAGREVPEKFNARFSCTEREYEYWILNTKFPNPLLKNRAVWIHNPINLDRVESELNSILGKNDFKSFAKATSIKEKPTERFISHAGIVKSNDWNGLLKIKIRGSGFLHNMVRILIGSILQISNEKLKVGIREIMQMQDRERAGITLPPYGLYFYRAYYKEYPQIDSLYNSEILYERKII